MSSLKLNYSKVDHSNVTNFLQKVTSKNNICICIKTSDKNMGNNKSEKGGSNLSYCQVNDHC